VRTEECPSCVWATCRGSPLAEINPLVDFEVKGNQISFVNLGQAQGLSDSCVYNYTWSRFDNRTQRSEALTEEQSSQGTSLDIPAVDAEYLVARIVTDSSDQPMWATAVHVYLRRKAARWEVVGVERENYSPAGRLEVNQMSR